MSAKNLKNAESFRRVTAYFRDPSDEAPTGYVVTPTGWSNYGALKDAPTFSQPIDTNSISFADKGATINTSSRSSVTVTIPVGQFDEDTKPLIFGESGADGVFDGGGDSDLTAKDILVDYEFISGKKMQLFFPAGTPTSIGDYQPTSDDAANVELEYTVDPSTVLNGKSYRRMDYIPASS